MGKLLVLKLGGSLLTDKMKPYSLRNDVLKSASAEVAGCLRNGIIEKLVIVHGVGSYGHPPVIEHKLYKGFVDKSQLLPLSYTQSKVNELRYAVTSSLQDVGIPVNLFHTSSISSAKNGKIISMNLDAVKGFLNVGMIPVLGGDMVWDAEIGFSVGSGDQVAAYLATELGATDLVFATDVAGVYNSDPKKSPEAQLISELKLSDLDGLSTGFTSGDASGAMKGKLRTLANMDTELKKGMKISIISMMEPNRLCGLLLGEKVKATIIRH